MRPPYLQIETNFITGKAPLVAAFAGIPPALALGHSVLLFDFAVTSTSTKAKPPDGVFLDPDAPTILEVAVGWTGEPGKLFAAFVRAGAIERLEIGARVRGLDRYKTVWAEAVRRSEKAKAAADKRWGRDAPEMLDACSDDAQPMPGACSTDARGMLGASKTQTKTQTKEAAVVASPEARAHCIFQATAWSEKFAAPATSPPESEFADWYAAALAALLPHGKGDAELRAAYLAFLADPFWSAQSRIRCPWSAWVKQWRNFLPAAAVVPKHKPMLRVTPEGGSRGVA